MSTTTKSESECPDCGGREWIVAPDGGVGSAKRCETCRPRLEQILRLSNVPEKYVGFTDDAWLSWKKGWPRPFQRWDKKGPLTIWGSTGTGKTSLAVAIMSRWIKSGRSAWFFDVAEVLADIQDSFGNGGDQSERRRLESIFQSPRLIIWDDPGQHYDTPWANSIIVQKWRHRLNRQLPFIVTTNLGLSDQGCSIGKMFGQAMVSRLMEGCEIELRGVDHRMEAAKRKAKAAT